MNLQTKIVIFIIGTCCLIATTNAAGCQCQCETPKCFDCNICNKDCTKLQQNCDTDYIANARRFLCEMENENCKKKQGCDVPPVAVSVYPANYLATEPQYQPQHFQARKNCCYRLTGINDKTLSAIKTGGACVQLFEGTDCTGANIKLDSTTPAACLEWIDCDARIKAGGIKFNDRTSSLQLC